MYMRIPCWAFANVGQHLIDIKIDEVDSFEIIDIPIIDIPIIDIPIIDIPIIDVPIIDIPIIDIPIIDIPIIDIPIIDIPIIDIPIKIYETKVDLDETLYDNFLSMFENITNYIHTENSITRIMIELYT
jgi:hypothetical protein